MLGFALDVVRSYGTARVGVVLGLTALWWACAVGVTVVLKVALGGTAHGRRAEGGFPYPLTLTLFANIGTAVVTGLISLALDGRQCLTVTGTPGSQSAAAHPRGGNVLRVTSREALLCEDSTGHQQEHFDSDGGDSGTGVADSRSSASAPSDAAPGRDAADPGGCGGPPGGSGGRCGTSALFRACCGSKPSSRSTSSSWNSRDSRAEPAASEAASEPVQTALAAADRQRAAKVTSQCWLKCVHGLTVVTSGGRATIVVIGLLQGLALGVKNEALLLLSVSTRTMIFALNVLAVMLIARLCGLETLRRMKLLAAALLAVGGVMQGLATLEHLRSSPRSDSLLGCTLAVLALFLDALRWVLLQAVFSTQEVLNLEPPAVPDPGGESTRRSPGADASSSAGAPRPHQVAKFAMVSWTMWMTTPLCLLLSIVFEPAGLSQAWQRRAALTQVVALLTLGVIGINLTEFGVVQWTSAVTFNVLSQLHSIPMVLAGVLCFGEDVALVQGFGFFVCLVGAVIYSWAKAKESHSCLTPQEGDAASSFDLHRDDEDGTAPTHAIDWSGGEPAAATSAR